MVNFPQIMWNIELDVFLGALETIDLWPVKKWIQGSSVVEVRLFCLSCRRQKGRAVVWGSCHFTARSRDPRTLHSVVTTPPCLCCRWSTEGTPILRKWAPPSRESWRTWATPTPTAWFGSPRWVAHAHLQAVGSSKGACFRA